MADHNDLGKAGEAMAAEWLAGRGYKILHRNWRHLHHEIDIIAARGKFLHFVEVKTKKASSLGHPEDSVTRKKFKYLQKAANEYLHLNPGHPWIQYDILSITLQPGGKAEFFLIEDVYL
ncbi:MAG: YraN family protein [Bacteroidetes bacterium]|nr:YraN family protein [Bacteroidota bacterium]